MTRALCGVQASPALALRQHGVVPAMRCKRCAVVAGTWPSPARPRPDLEVRWGYSAGKAHLVLAGQVA